MPGNANNLVSRPINIFVAGSAVQKDTVMSVVVDQDLGQPDMCAITLNHTGHDVANKAKLADAIEVKIENSSLFKGEIVGVEANYRDRSDAKFVLRAFNRLHRLSRGRSSQTYLKMTDQAIAESVAKNNGLSAHCGKSTSIKHEYVYQHNQTDLEFLRLRAARIGFEVWVEDQTLHFDRPRSDESSGIKLQFQKPTEDYFTKSFTPRLSGAQLVSKVEVHGWDPVKKKEIVGTASAAGSRMGRQVGAKAADAFGHKVSYEVEYPIFSVEEAKAIAEARLVEASMGYIVGEAACVGNTELKPGKVVEIDVPNFSSSQDRFGGRYMIVGACHRYLPASESGSGGYTAELRLRRDADGKA